MSVPKVFVSYSHDSDSHKEWVLNLSSCLRHNGIDVSLDLWDLSPGESLGRFMEQNMSQADRVIIVCTTEYVKKANDCIGGVAYEGLIATSEIVGDVGTKKFIPIVRNNVREKKIPRYMGERLYIDFSVDADFDKNMDWLVREIYGFPKLPKPKLGNSPFLNTNSESVRIKPVWTDYFKIETSNFAPPTAVSIKIQYRIWAENPNIPLMIRFSSDDAGQGAFQELSGPSGIAEIFLNSGPTFFFSLSSPDVHYEILALGYEDNF
ncbi:toll/interleukin-1 receptor domain-containing protein [Oryzomicrobium sp.]|uniref:toll/interleukin-1 receptor domain-containing protein n=1 Tax=Oryzomicrobium sp. TaxID=1911578 RepID=UPI0025DDDD68|nr:toll/interleukin-1 receptor domain-containing protein [Oryzomicrobium sp.]MCE1243065.1 toll/interleukin-1 receptor domain-containing protein [Oryzomicrobium sp.]